MRRVFVALANQIPDREVIRQRHAAGGVALNETVVAGADDQHARGVRKLDQERDGALRQGRQGSRDQS